MRLAVLVISLILCGVWADMCIPGYRANGHHYSYGITWPVVVYAWIPGWAVILGVAYLLVRKKKR
jgi:hypothetical protein